MSRAKKYLEDDASETRTSVDEIKSIWVASDDDDVVDQVKALATQYFPNVVPENVAWISGGGKDGTVQTRSELEVRNGFNLGTGFNAFATGRKPIVGDIFLELV